MRASKLITISTVAASAVAVLMGGASFAVAHASSGSMQSSTQSNNLAQGRAANPRVAESTMHQGKVSRERGWKTLNLRGSERGQSMAAMHGGAITGTRGQTTTSGRSPLASSQGPRIAQQNQGQFQSRKAIGQKNAAGPAYASGSSQEMGASLNGQQRLRDIVSNRQDLPRLSRFDANVRINATAPKDVRLAAIPQQMARMYPQFRGDRVFLYRNNVVIVDPTTSRIIAKLPT